VARELGGLQPAQDFLFVALADEHAAETEGGDFGFGRIKERCTRRKACSGSFSSRKVMR
jgi:hypothetical protein